MGFSKAYTSLNFSRGKYVARARRFFSTAIMVGLPLFVAAGCRAIESFNPVTRQGLSIANLFIVVLVISAVIFLLVAGLLVYILFRYRGRPGEQDPPQVHGNRNLEIVWTAAPALIVLVLFLLGLQTMNTVNATDPSALRIKVIGHQWWWEFQYPDLGVATANEVHVPVGVPLKFELESADVIHSFWVPKLGWKKDAIPGKTNDMWVQFDQPGVYDGPCTEYCGLQHAWMRIRLAALTAEQFKAWTEQQRRSASDRPAGATAGQEVFLRNTCVNCHAVRGTPAAGKVGPDLTHFASRSTIGAGVLANTPQNLRRWVKEVQTVKPGVLMPNYPELSDDDVTALVEFLGGLK